MSIATFVATVIGSGAGVVSAILVVIEMVRRR